MKFCAFFDPFLFNQFNEFGRVEEGEDVVTEIFPFRDFDRKVKVTILSPPVTVLKSLKTTV